MANSNTTHPNAIPHVETPSELLRKIWTYNPEIAALLRKSLSDEEARSDFYSHLTRLEQRQETYP